MTTDLTLHRILNAPRERVWACWTQPDQMAHWFFPADMTILSTSFEPLRGGAWRTVMQDPASGTTMTVQGTFLTVDAPHRLIFTHGWEDADGQVATLTRVTITLDDINGKTRLSLVQQGLASDSSRDGHRGGWTQTLDHLAAHLTSA